MQAGRDNVLKRMEQDYDSRMEEQVEDLRDKMRLLQVDRKSSIDVLEASKQTNKEYIRQLKAENHELRKQLADAKHIGGGSSGSLPLNPTLGAAGAVIADIDEECTQAVAHLNRLRKQYDEVRHRVQSQVALLEELKDSVKDLELESKKPSLEDTPETRKIRMLENRLDKAMIKFNEAQSIRKTYEQIVKRLKEERVGFDNQLAALERALAAKQHDFDELVLLSSDATHAKESIQQELEKARGEFEEEKRQREKELHEKQQYVKIRLEMSTRSEKRERHKTELSAKEAGDLDVEGERQLKQSLSMTSLQQGLISEEKKEHRSKIDIFESAFRKIKEATGVSDVNEVIQKIVSQESTTDNLINLSKENQSRLEHLQADQAALKARVEELKYSGSAGGHHRKMVDDHEQNLVLASAKLERAKLKYERLAKVLISVKAGVEHLVDKLESVREDDQVVVVTDETIVEALQESEMTLARLLNQIKGAAAPVALAAAGSGAAAVASQKRRDSNLGIVRKLSVKSPAASEEISDVEMLMARPYNQRIPLPGEMTTDEIENEEIAAGSIALEDTEEALSRERVKRASNQVVLAQDKKKKRSAKKKRKDAMDDSDDEDAPGGMENGSMASSRFNTQAGATRLGTSPSKSK